MKRRIEASNASHWSAETLAILRDAIPASESADGSGPPNILYTIGHHPTLLRPFLQFAAALAIGGVLKRREAEILALRAAWHCRSRFEWAHHVEYATTQGMSPDEIQAIAEGPDGSTWSDRERLLLRSADELHTTRDLSDRLFEALGEHWNEAEIVEIIFVVGHYTMLSMVANATRVPLESRFDSAPYRMP